MLATGLTEVEAQGDISSAIPAYEIAPSPAPSPQAGGGRDGGKGPYELRPISARDDHEHSSAATLAREIGAAGHAVFAIARGARGRKLTPILRSNFPDLPPLAAGCLIDAVMHSMTPFCWTGGKTDANAFADLRWARWLKSPLPGSAALAFPVAAGRSENGLVVFVGGSLSVSDRTLPDLHRRCFGFFAEVCARRESGAPETASLAKRELECIRLASDGLTSEEIARALGLSLHTANQYLAEAARKLNANGRMHAVAKALRLGLID
jgi:DNA-binding CsgD family transcriptional regulator